MPGRRIKKGTRGAAAQYIGRSAALRKLQVSLADFRRLCILKGVYPRDPKKKLKKPDQTYYHVKDITFLSQESLIRTFREQKSFSKKIRRATGRHENSIAQNLKRREPRYTLHHLIRERYPTFVEAVGDLDDSLSSLALFAALPADDYREIPAEVVKQSCELIDHFHLYVATTHSLRKVFVSIKGYYFQAAVCGVNVTWLLPHSFCQSLPSQVDYRVMLTFQELYRTLGRFVNFKLYQLADLSYPPEVDRQLEKLGMRFLAMKCVCLSDTRREPAELNGGNKCGKERLDTSAPSTAEQLNDGSSRAESGSYGEFRNDDRKPLEVTASVSEAKGRDTPSPYVERFIDTSEDGNMAGGLFRNLFFFLSREIPRVPFVLIIRSAGGTVGWQDDCSPIEQTDPRITHHVMDRPVQFLQKVLDPADSTRLLSREYIQPQWVCDSFNSRSLLPLHNYKAGETLPPHLSPFVDASSVGLQAPQRKPLEGMQNSGEAASEGQDALAKIGVDGYGCIDPESDDCASEADQMEKAGDLESTELDARRFEQEIESERKGRDHNAAEEVQQTAANSSDEEHVGAVHKKRQHKHMAKTQTFVEHKSKLLQKKRSEKEAEELERRKAMMTKKHKALFERIEIGKQRKAEEAHKLARRREIRQQSKAS
eukprot:GHVQ01006015.1.p1 GENE.GHVQ01006015.1~~GHVQ01006015.1.p1  ORF type:complete len:653 (-),score=73.14 GHVQ01006015.1:2830-4788(-)